MTLWFYGDISSFVPFQKNEMLTVEKHKKKPVKLAFSLSNLLFIRRLLFMKLYEFIELLNRNSFTQNSFFTV